MDTPGLDPRRHRDALVGLSRINWISRSDRILWKPIETVLKEQRKHLSLLDVAAGGGDIPIRLGQRAKRLGHSLEIHAIDRSEVAIEYARRKAAAVGVPITFHCLDAVHDPWPSSFDIVTSSLFLHHLDDSAAELLLQRVRDAAGVVAIVNDLRRSRLGYAVAWLATRLLTRSQVVHIDGPRSVAAAFTLEEILALAENAGWYGATIARRWPWRYSLEWRRPT